MSLPSDRKQERGRPEEEGDRAPDSAGRTPPAGPHAKPEHTNEEATPGAGTLPDEQDPGGATSG